MRRRGDIIGVWSLLIREDDIVLEKQQMLLNYSLKLENLSTGLKSMLIERMISLGLLCEGSILILDEPEINIHPLRE